MSDRLVCLGSKGGPALRPGGPWPSSSLLEFGGRTIVVDCGLGVTRGLSKDALNKPKVAPFMESIEQSVVHYGKST